MTSKLVQSPEIQKLLDRVGGLDVPGGDQRYKKILRKIVSNLFETIDEFDVSDEEFWQALDFLASGAPEFGLLAPGLGLERFLDIRADIASKKHGAEGGTARTIEGPLYVPGAPESNGWARLDDNTETGEVLIMKGRALDTAGHPIKGALVEVWQANTQGFYSHFGPPQSKYNYRRSIRTGADGSYGFRSLVPSGYSVPPGGATDRLTKAVGRHGSRPAHIHFFVSSAGFRRLTTQINIAGDPLLHDDFAYATRDELIPELVRVENPAKIKEYGLAGPYAEIHFDFILGRAQKDEDEKLSSRRRVPAPA